MNATKKLSARVAIVLSLFAATAAFARTHVDALGADVVELDAALRTRPITGQ